jgi:hypothetical protein
MYVCIKCAHVSLQVNTCNNTFFSILDLLNKPEKSEVTKDSYCLQYGSGGGR